jgi:hypothetical protein
MINKLIVLVLILSQITLAQNKVLSHKKIYTELSAGFNYSQFYTTDNIGDYGINVGIYRRKKLNNNWQVKSGINYSTNNSKLKNVTVLPMYLIDWENDNYLYWRDFEFKYSYLEINTFLEIPIYTIYNLEVYAMVGCGLEINIKRKNKNKIIKYELFDKEKDTYDYSTNDHDVPPGLFTTIDNSDFTLQAGSSFVYNRIVISLYYELSTIGMRYIDNMEFGEKYITFNTTLGFLI